jgi:transcriptional regulator with XRE-family HTH domain
MRLKKLRKARGLSQEKVAALVGISRVHLANLESPNTAKHHRAPSLATLEKLARALKVKVADLVK